MKKLFYAFVMSGLSVNVEALKIKVFWQSKANEYHKVTLHTNLTQKIYWKRHKRLSASAEERSSKELSMRQGLFKNSWCRAFLVVRIGEISSLRLVGFQVWGWGEYRSWWNLILRYWWISKTEMRAWTFYPMQRVPTQSEVRDAFGWRPW